MSYSGLKIATADVVTLSSNVVIPITTLQTVVYNCIIIADPQNVGNVYIGDAGVTASTGIPLEPGNTLTLSVEGSEKHKEFSLNEVYLISSTSGNKVRSAYFKRR